jgi:uncharacterized SAM-binding protein YcdF (DUF218 family)
MLFYIQKTILYLLLPPSGPLLLILAGFLFSLTRHKKAGKVLVVTGIALLYLLSTEAVATRLIAPLELEHAPLQKEKVLSADAIVVLTAGVTDLSYIGLKPQPSRTSVFRLVKGISIFRQMSDTPMIICGGAGAPEKPGLSEGAALADVAGSLGIPKKDLILEGRSKNTYEGAREVSRILKGKGKRIVLVTSAHHMGRSVKFFEKAGFEVLPAPTDYISEGRSLNFYSLVPSAGDMGISATALYEYLSRLWYMMRDFIR